MDWCLKDGFEAAAQKKFPDLIVTRASVNVNVEGNGIVYFTDGTYCIISRSEIDPLP